MNDVAKLANVSKSTVSLVINGKPGVSNETREKVMDILRSNGYKRQRSVKGNIIKRTFNIGFFAIKSKNFINDDFQHMPFFDKLLNVLSEQTSSYGGVLIVNTITDNGNLKEELSEIKKKQHIDGMIVLGTEMTREQALDFKSVESNLVIVDTIFPSVDCDFVSIDNYMGGYMAAQNILKKGYRKIGFAGSLAHINNFVERRKGFLECLQQNAVKIRDKDFYSVDPTSLNPQNNEFERIMKDRDHPEAIFCEDDYIAIRLSKACVKLGVKVPKDISIMGFDDIYEGQLIVPELTTMHVPVEDMSEIALTKLFDRLKGKGSKYSSKTFVGVSFVERASL